MKKLSFLVVFLLVFSPFLAAGNSLSRVYGSDKHSINMPPKRVLSPKERSTNSQSSREKRRLRELERRVDKLERKSRKKISTGSYKWNVFTRQFELVK
ncbi:hypothetical protein LCGC14_1253750 [marine sediment metagenome]|uniref:Uncharacterized protein n=1 Tax=marine sediment metagenome TaxID=412755 RepID=A0A0F9NJB6_9ZZZZ